MTYTIAWIGEIALAIRADSGSSISFALEGGQRVPEEFQKGDHVEIEIHPHPGGYFQITHVATGKVLKVAYT